MMGGERELTIQAGRIKLDVKSAEDLTAKPVLQEHFGKDVWTHPIMDVLRKTECLCMQCDNFKPESKDNCKISDALFQVCVKEDVALAVTRCPVWVPNTLRK